MKLYYSPGACSLSPHIALHEAGLAFTPVLASTKSHKLQDGTDYYTINALGYVPVLELDNGERLREGPAIVQYIADQVPERHLEFRHGHRAFARDGCDCRRIRQATVSVLPRDNRAGIYPKARTQLAR